jgi:hypothetical protein
LDEVGLAAHDRARPGVAAEVGLGGVGRWRMRWKTPAARGASRGVNAALLTICQASGVDPESSAFVIGAGTLTNLLWALTQFLVAVSALAWIAWCVTGLSFGPRFRTIAIVLAWSGVGLAVIALLVALGRLDDSSPAAATYRTAVVINPPTTSEDDRASAFQAIVTSALFPVVMLILLTRPPVKELFAHRPRRRAARRTT